MLIYLDANIVQYCSDFEDYIFGTSESCSVIEPKARQEIDALKKLVELEQLTEGWVVASSPHLMNELRAGRPTPTQDKNSRLLHDAWKESDWMENGDSVPSEVDRVAQSLKTLNLSSPDRRHLAEAVSVQASWFLTNDKNTLREANKKNSADLLRGLRVVRPSAFISEISVGLFLR